FDLFPLVVRPNLSHEQWQSQTSIDFSVGLRRSESLSQSLPSTCQELPQSSQLQQIAEGLILELRQPGGHGQASIVSLAIPSQGMEQCPQGVSAFSDRYQLASSPPRHRFPLLENSERISFPGVAAGISGARLTALGAGDPYCDCDPLRMIVRPDP